MPDFEELGGRGIEATAQTLDTSLLNQLFEKYKVKAPMSASSSVQSTTSPFSLLSQCNLEQMSLMSSENTLSSSTNQANSWSEAWNRWLRLSKSTSLAPHDTSSPGLFELMAEKGGDRAKQRTWLWHSSIENSGFQTRHCQRLDKFFRGRREHCACTEMSCGIRTGWVECAEPRPQARLGMGEECQRMGTAGGRSWRRYHGSQTGKELLLPAYPSHSLLPRTPTRPGPCVDILYK